MSNWALYGAKVLNPGDLSARPATVLVEAGKFRSLLAPEVPIPDRFAPVDLSDHLLIPGLINAHMHGHANLLKGLCNAWSLEMSLTNGPWMAGIRDPDTIYQSTLLGASEMIANGVTACYDLAFQFPCPSIEGFQAMASAYRDAGMRAWIAPMVSDKGFFDSVPGLRKHLLERGCSLSRLPLAPTGEEVLSACSDIFNTLEWKSGVFEPAIAPTIAMHCSRDFMRSCKELADVHHARVHMHVAEAQFQARAGEDLFGRSILEETASLGLLDERFTAAHGVWLQEEDFRLLADSGASLIHMPGSNLRLGCGIADAALARRHGVTLALATDGANSSDSLSVLRAMQLAAMVSRSWGRAPIDWLESDSVFAMATEGGAAALGQKGKLGRIESGYEADCVALNLATHSYSPAGSELNQLVNAESGSSVRSVMIGGRWVVRDERPAGFDFVRLRSEAQAAEARWRSDNRTLRSAFEPLVPHVVEYVQAYGSAHRGPRRYVG